MSVGVLALVLLAVVVFKNGFSTTPAHVLAEHPDARWQGGPDGGHYIEITRSEPPYFFVQVRHESGDLWDEGWLKYEDGDASALTTDKAGDLNVMPTIGAPLPPRIRVLGQYMGRRRGEAVLEHDHRQQYQCQYAHRHEQTF
ncbi:hypothetical protein [Pseudomonas protegens]|uniref:hypothetical protein n=1 Tax=Pseudomonas protegens TaxID=380021 RepID=UPI001FF07F1F|nr:hypothetical protein [Pseudomonas protegens]